MSRKRDDAVLVTRREVAQQHGVKPMQVHRWVQDGAPVARRGGPGRPALYDPIAVARWKAARDGAAERQMVSVTQARVERDLAQAELARQLHAQRSGRLVDVAAVTAIWGRHVAAVRQRLLSWSTTLTARLHRAAINGGLAGIEAVLDEHVRRVLTELSAGPIVSDDDGPAPETGAPR